MLRKKEDIKLALKEKIMIAFFWLIALAMAYMVYLKIETLLH